MQKKWLWKLHLESDALCNYIVSHGGESSTNIWSLMGVKGNRCDSWMLSFKNNTRLISWNSYLLPVLFYFFPKEKTASNKLVLLRCNKRVLLELLKFSLSILKRKLLIDTGINLNFDPLGIVWRNGVNGRLNRVKVSTTRLVHDNCRCKFRATISSSATIISYGDSERKG